MGGGGDLVVALALYLGPQQPPMANSSQLKKMGTNFALAVLYHIVVKSLPLKLVIL